MSIQSCNEPSCFPGNDKSLIATVVVPKPRDLGGFQVRRVLPAIEQRAIGPFVFFDMMGPLTLKTGFELEVRPHPHIGLATLTWLFEGALMHRDSLGSVQVIHPGAVNLMTAGRGIVHSERVSQAGLGLGASVSGAQFWLALPQTEEECDPTFAHYPAATLPMFESEGMTGCVIIGRFNNAISPVSFPHPALCVDLKLATGANLILDDTHAERAIYLVSGAVGCGGERVEEQRLVVFAPVKR